MTQKELDSLVQILSLLLATYEPELQPLDLDKVDSYSYRIGFREGARSAYADTICRLRGVQTESASNVTRIGGGAA